MRLVLLALSCVLAGCASKSNEISASYVSSLQYENLTSRQLAEEAQRVSQRAAVASGVQDNQANKDAVSTAVADMPGFMKALTESQRDAIAHYLAGSVVSSARPFIACSAPIG